MASDPSDLFPVIAQIAATFAGFGSLASGIGRWRGGADPRMDAFRLSLMLFATLAATLLGLLPATLAALSFTVEAALRLSAVAAVIVLAVNTPVSAKWVLRLRQVEGFDLAAGVVHSICRLTALAAFAVCALDWSPGRAAGIYLLGLMGLLGSSTVMFSRVIVSILGPHREADDSPS